MGKVSVITPWLDCPELIKTYERTYAGCEIIIIDNGSQPDTAKRLKAVELRKDIPGVYIRNETNAKYAAANNQGLERATGDVIVFANNDTEWTGNGRFVDAVLADVKPGALYGPSLMTRNIGGKQCPYIEGYCIAGTREDWIMLGGWDAENFSGMYWEDNDVCYRAMSAGLELVQTNWPIWHYGNYTSGRTPGAYDNSRTNLEAFIEKVQNG